MAQIYSQGRGNDGLLEARLVVSRNGHNVSYVDRAAWLPRGDGEPRFNHTGVYEGGSHWARFHAWQGWWGVTEGVEEVDGVRWCCVMLRVALPAQGILMRRPARWYKAWSTRALRLLFMLGDRSTPTEGEFQTVLLIYAFRRPPHTVLTLNVVTTVVVVLMALWPLVLGQVRGLDHAAVSIRPRCPVQG